MTTTSVWLLLSLPLLTCESPQTIDWESRKLEIPIRYDVARKALIEELRLYVSEDTGKTWRRYATAKPDAQVFSFEAPREGVFSFGLVIVATNGERDPPDLSQLVPIYHVRFARTAFRIPNTQKDDADHAWDQLKALYERDARNALANMSVFAHQVRVRYLEHQLAASRREIRELRTKLEPKEKGSRE